MAQDDNKNANPAIPSQPGNVVAPGSSPSTEPNQVPQTPAAPSQVAPVRQPPTSPESVQAYDIPEDRVHLYQSPMDTEDASAIDAASESNVVDWTASEFVEHQKSSSWYGGLLAIAAVIAGFVYLLTRDIISTIVVLICAGAFGVLGSKKPRQLHYHLDNGGVTVGAKYHAYASFRSFSIIPEGAFSSIVFMPLKRFAQTTTIYYAPEDEDMIISVVANYLPLEEHKKDAIDNLMKRIRF